MNIDYLKDKILPVREKEILEGKNLATEQPIYVVLDLRENVVSGHSDYSPVTNYKEVMPADGYLDMHEEAEDRTFELTSKGMSGPERVTRFYTDRIVAFFLTYQGADDYLKYQSHNLNDPYIYVFNTGYDNREMNSLFKKNKIRTHKEWLRKKEEKESDR